jgi:hypothetical protein
MCSRYRFAIQKLIILLISYCIELETFYLCIVKNAPYQKVFQVKALDFNWVCSIYHVLAFCTISHFLEFSGSLSVSSKVGNINERTVDIKLNMRSDFQCKPLIPILIEIKQVVLKIKHTDEWIWSL